VARIRTIKPEFPDDERLGSVSRDARLLFILTWTRADDHGRIRGAPAFLKGQLYPYDGDVTPGMVAEWLKELEEIGVMRPYSVRGERYLMVTNWEKHQRIDNAGKPTCPPPPFAEDGGEIPRDLPPVDNQKADAAPPQSVDDSGVTPSPRTLAANRGDSPLDLGPRTRTSTTARAKSTSDTPPSTAMGNEDDAVTDERSVIEVIARRDLIEAKARTEVRNEAGYLAKLKAERAATDGAMVRAVLAEHPDWDAERVATYVDGRRVGPPPAYATEGTGNGVKPPADIRDLAAQARADAAARRAERENR
jgi:hypothetical protein